MQLSAENFFDVGRCRRILSLLSFEKLGYLLEEVSSYLKGKQLATLGVEGELFEKVDKVCFDAELFHALVQAFKVVEKLIRFFEGPFVLVTSGVDLRPKLFQTPRHMQLARVKREFLVFSR